MNCPHQHCDYESNTERGVNIHYSKKHRSSVNASCSWCGDDIENVTPWRAKQSDTLFCDMECQSKWQSSNREYPVNKQSLICDECSEQFLRYESKTRNNDRTFCSRDCHAAWVRKNMRPEDHPAWTGGCSGYRGPNWYEQRQKALRRAQARCEHPVCNKTSRDRGRALDVHHIIPFVIGVTGGYFDEVEEANNLDNLIVLCDKHHKELEPSKKMLEPIEV